MEDSYLEIINKRKQIEIANIINKIYKEICDEVLLNNEELQRYVKKNLNSIVEIIYNAVKQSTLDKIFITKIFYQNFIFI